MLKILLSMATVTALTTTVFAPAALAEEEAAVFAGGCFWCVEKDMDHVEGVLSTTSGYAGGTKSAPTYEDHEGYTEAVKVVFDNSVLSYETLANHFLRTIDVTDAGGQFCDRGPSYVSALFPIGAGQRTTAEAAVKLAEKDLGQAIATPILDTVNFADGEDYHQDYYKGENLKVTRFGIIKQSEAYAKYREGCGRDARVKQIWGDKAFSFPIPQSGS